MQGLNAQVPAKIKLEIIDRALDGIKGERGGFAGDPYDIDGYHPRFDDDDNVIGWYSRDKRLKEIDVTDRSKINELNLRYDIRQGKGEFHSWQMRMAIESLSYDERCIVRVTFVVQIIAIFLGNPMPKNLADRLCMLAIFAFGIAFSSFAMAAEDYPMQAGG